MGSSDRGRRHAMMETNQPQHGHSKYGQKMKLNYITLTISHFHTHIHNTLPRSLTT